jgi:hypothetical protein
VAARATEVVRIASARVGVIFDRVQRGMPIGPFRLAPRADILNAAALGACQLVRDALAKYVRIND